MPSERTATMLARAAPRQSGAAGDSPVLERTEPRMARDPTVEFDSLEAPLSVESNRRAWRIALPAVSLCVLWIVGWYWSTGSGMVKIWARSDTFAHGFVVLPIVLWLIWRDRSLLGRVTPRPNFWALAPLAVAGFTWMVGELTSTNAVSQLALVALLVLTVPAVLGVPAMRELGFPLAFLFFAVPIGEFVMPKLMEWTADFTVLALRLSGIPVYREALQFVIPSGNWSVVEACSGIRYLIASLMVGTLYAYLNYRSLSRRLIFIGFAILVPIVANWLRAYMIVMLGHLSGNTLAVGVDHLIYGWLFFGIVIMIMFAIGARWREDYAAEVDAATVPVVREEVTPPGRFWLAGLAVAVVAAIWQVGYSALEGRDPAPLSQFATVASGWDSAPGGLTAWQPRFNDPSAESHRTFNKEGRGVGLYLAYYRNQDYGRKLVNSENVLVASLDPAWSKVASGTREVSLNQQALMIDTAELRGARGHELVAWQWFWINGQWTASPYWAKVYTALSRLQGRGDDSAAVVVYTRKEVPGGPDAVLATFVRDHAASIAAALRETSENR